MLAEPLLFSRTASKNPDVIHRYFDLLEETMHANGLMHRPAKVFNCNKGGIPLMHKPPKEVAKVGQKRNGGFQSKPEMTVGEVPGTFYGLSESGRIDLKNGLKITFRCTFHQLDPFSSCLMGSI